MTATKFTETELKLRLPSSLPDITCIDGEVAEFQNVDWLRALADEAALPGSESGKPGTADSSTILSLLTHSEGTELPYGASLLAIHCPAALPGEKFYIIVTQNGSLAAYSPTRGLQYLSANGSLQATDIRRTLTFGNFIMIITSEGIRMLIFDETELSYLCPADLPEAPEVSYNLSPSTLTGYVNFTGDLPEMDVAVDIPAILDATETDLHNWLDSGVNSAVSEEVRMRVYKAVGEAVAQYEEIAVANGKFLLPPHCVAAFDGRLPTTPAIPAAGAGAYYKTPYALLLSWSYHAEILHLRIAFSLRPLTLSANFSLSETAQLWARLFRNLTIAVAGSPAWRTSSRKSAPAIGFSSFVDPEGSRSGFAFRFAARDSAEITDLISERRDFRIAARAPLENTISGTVIVKNPDREGSIAEAYKPDYRDFNIPAPYDGISTNLGFALYGGTLIRKTESGTTSSEFSTRSVISSDPQYPFLFCNVCKAAEGDISALALTSAARIASPGGRHPLHVIASDGIRQLNADGNGGYLIGKLISRLSADKNSPVAVAPEAVTFSAGGHLWNLTMNSKLSDLNLNLPEGDWHHMEWLDNSAILLRAPGVTLLIDVMQKSVIELSDVSLRPLLRHEGKILTVNSSGELIILSAHRQPADSSVTGIATADSASNISTVTTRPLKFGKPGRKKRIHALITAHPMIAATIEGSDNLEDWSTLLSSTRGNGLKALRLPACRFFRLRLECDPELSAGLASLTISLKIL